MRFALVFLLLGALATVGAHAVMTEWADLIDRTTRTSDPPARPGTDEPYDTSRMTSLPGDEAAPPGFPSYKQASVATAIVLVVISLLGIITVRVARRTPPARAPAEPRGPAARRDRAA